MKYVPSGEAPVVETWDGSAWSTPSVPTADDALTGVSCYSSNSCIAVGGGSPTTPPLVLEYDNGTWLPATSPTGPPGTTSNFVGSVSCVSGWDCVAEGTASGSDTAQQDYFAEAPLPPPAPPSASITSPSSGATYAPDQVVGTAFTCSEGAGGPGIKSCTDAKGSTSPGILDTTTLGSHTYSVSATSLDGQTATASITYSVADPTTTTLSASRNPGYVDQALTYVAQVSPPPDGGTVSFTDAGATISGCSAVPVNTTTGRAKCGVTYATKGSHSVVALYSGDADYISSPSPRWTERIVQIPTATTLAAWVHPVGGARSVTFIAKVYPRPDGGMVAFTDRSIALPGCSAVPVDPSTGKAKCQVSLGPDAASVDRRLFGRRQIQSIDLRRSAPDSSREGRVGHFTVPCSIWVHCPSIPG